MKTPHILIILSTFISSISFSFASTFSVFPEGDSTKKEAPENWFNLDREADNVQGVSTEKTYNELLKGKASETVVVAVIDGGVDIAHEDLEGKIWINEDEIPGNGKDDDGNGYIDDVNGWNFLGGKDGKNVNFDTYELTREYVRLSKKFENKAKDAIPKTEKEEFEYFQKVKKDYEKKLTETNELFENYQGMSDVIKQSVRLMAAYLNISEEELNAEYLSLVNSTDDKIKRAVSVLGYAYENDIKMEQLEEGIEYFENQLNYYLNKDFNPRNIVGDNYNDLTNKFYGNADVTGPDAEHGTHVAGIIAANRQNNLGIKGVAKDVKIMAIRAVPNGDEHDKDVANAIRYAVDNGAKIINMSFGKGYSPQKTYVDEAVLYAEKKGVLLVHAAGNDSENLDAADNFPNRGLDNRRKPAKNWLEIGASSWGDASNFVGEFSNYGKKSVDVFAPGVDINSTMPGSTYKAQNGTSMAAPVTSGVAAVLLSYYPDLSAIQVKDIIMKSSSKFDEMKVNKPGEPENEGDEDIVEFEKLSISGGIINAYEAVKLANSMTIKKKKR